MEAQDGLELLPLCIAGEFKRLREDLSLTNARWILYRQLYVHSEKRFNLLTASAPAFFEFLFYILRDDVFMALCRLADPGSTGGKENLSFRWIMTRLDDQDDTEQLRGKLQNTLDLFIAQCEPLEAHRDKRLAHRDLTTSLVSAAEPLPGVTVQMVDDALATAAEYLNTIEGHYSNSGTACEYFGMVGDVDSLVISVAEAMRYRDLERSGAIGFDDFDKSEWRNV